MGGELASGDLSLLVLLGSDGLLNCTVFERVPSVDTFLQVDAVRVKGHLDKPYFFDNVSVLLKDVN